MLQPPHHGAYSMTQEKQDQKGAAPDKGSGVQGEGDYRAAHRYRKEVDDFLAHADVEELAKKAEPQSAREAREMALAADRGLQRSKGDDSADAGAMYPGRKDGKA
jgi:hypothetical protein